MKLEKLQENDKITAFCRKKFVFQALYQLAQTTKMKFSKTKIVIRFNLPKICPSVLPFVFALSFSSFILSSNFLSGYFNVSLSSVAVTLIRILINFVTQLL